MTFTGSLRLDFGDWGPGVGRIAVLLEPLTWRDITVPAGFMSDGASVPRLFWWWLPPWGDVATRAALVHDWLLTLRDRYHPESAALLSDLGINLNAVTDRTRAEIDRLFYEALLDLGIPTWRAWPTYAGVRAYAIATETILPALGQAIDT